jgi:hypothetical protein
MKPLCFATLQIALTLLASSFCSGAQLVLFPSPQGQVTCTDSRAVLTNDAAETVLQVVTGTDATWPGVAFEPPQPWELAAYAEVAVELKNPGGAPVTVFCRVDNPGADGTRNCLTASANVPARGTAVIHVPLTRTTDDKLGGQLFGMRGYPVRAGGTGAIDPKKVTQILLFLTKPREPHAFQVRQIAARGRYVPPTAWADDAQPFFPFIDALGQYRHKQWSGKAVSPEDLHAKAQAEEKQLAARVGPKDWDKYGGWAKGPKRKSTGFFGVEKVGGKWWLIDPEGHLFFSHGVDCVRMLDTTPIDERESWFEGFPGKDPVFAEFLSKAYALKGHYEGRSPQCFSFAGANLLRKYGPQWKETYRAVIHRRLRSWGLNTIANWSDEGVRLLRLTPYTDTIGSGRTRMLEGSEGYWGKFPDVFDPSFREGLRRQMEDRKGKSAADPWCIGYFSDNEMSWGDELSLAVATLRSPPDQKAKQVLVDALQRQYSSVEKLNQAWGTAHGSWDALLQSREPPDQGKARRDLESFYTRMAEEYFRNVRESIKEVAPNQLYLGCRFAWVNARAAAAAAKFCDVVSYNLYQRSVAEFQFNGGADVPLIIGEFHLGALDRGMFHTGLVPVGDQGARAEAYKNYLRGAVAHPQFVGTHWFQYQDEPTTGRVYDEENYQIGLVDIADTPYAEMIEATREVGYGLYGVQR